MIKLLLTTILLSIPLISNADYHLRLNNQFDISGYIGYRYIWSSIGTDPIGSYPELGLLFNYNPNRYISTKIQLNVNRNALEHNAENFLTYAFLTYQNSFHEIPFKINIGKLRHEFELYNANIVNPSTRPGGTVAPQAIYWHNLSSTLTSGYGISVSAMLSDFKIKYTISKYIVVNEKQESLMWTGVDFVSMDPYFGSSQIINFNYEPNHLPIIIKSSWSRIKLNKDIKDLQFATFGVEYDTNTFSTSAEILLVRSFGNDWIDVDKLRFGYSISAGYYLYDDLEFHANANIYENSTGINNSIPDAANKWKDFSVGVTKYYKSFEFKADIHKVYGGRTLKPKDWTNNGIDDWWYVGTSIVFHF